MKTHRLEKLAPLLLPALAIPGLWHFLAYGLPQRSADGLLHLLRLALLNQHVQHGMLYPRWMPELVLGHGYPLLNFYGPAAYYLALAFRLLGLSLAPSLIAAFAVLFGLAGLGAYLLARDTLRPNYPAAALVAAVAYMYSPYLLTNAYVRGAIAEVAAQALLPWIFWSTGRLMRRPDRRVAYLIVVALSMGGLAVSHNITLLFLPPAWLAFVAVQWFATGRRRSDLLWAVAGGAAAAGLSAFFTVPLVLERQYLASTAYQISAQFLPENVWTWRNFLDTRLVFEYTFDVPFQLGLVQLALAVAGLIAARRRDAIWLYWIGLAAVSGLLIGAWATQLWLANSLLLIAQFPWRLLSLLSLPLALFAGAVVAVPARPIVRWLAAATLVALVIWANTPRLDWMLGWVPNDAARVVPSISQFESDTGALGTGSSAEFMPKWVRSAQPGPVETVEGAPRVTSVEAADDFRIAFRVTGEQAGPLRLLTSYFPGWRAVDETGAGLATSPSTDSGLLTVAAPAGDHLITAWWAPTTVEWAASATTLLTLLALAILAGAQTSTRPWAALLTALLALGVVTFVARPAAQRVVATEPRLALAGVTSLGSRVAVEDEGVWVYPYWFAGSQPSADLRIRWEIRTSAGDIVAAREARPYHNATSAADWPPDTLVDDAHFLPLPDGLAAGSYEVWAKLFSEGQVSEAAQLSAFSLDAPVSSPATPEHPVQAQFGDQVGLIGYDAPASGDRPVPARIDAVVSAGDSIKYILHWRAVAPLRENYHGFLHLLDETGATLAKRDQLAGGETRFAPLLWGTGNVVRDGYPLRIPADAQSGVYWPSAGLYDFQTLERLPITAGEDTGLNAARLGPIKVLGATSARPQKPLDVRIADVARLAGYDLALPAGGLAAGDTFTVTLHYRVEKTPAAAYTRFLHFFSPELGMAAQGDAEPANGRNPTWAWVPGETLTDTATLTVSPDAAPGRYQLRAGLYDPAANAARLPLMDHSGARLADDIAVLTELDVSAAR